MNGFRCNFFLENTLCAFRALPSNPNVGDVIRLNGICYIVKLVVWCLDEEQDYRTKLNISIELEKLA